MLQITRFQKNNSNIPLETTIQKASGLTQAK